MHQFPDSGGRAEARNPQHPTARARTLRLSSAAAAVLALSLQGCGSGGDTASAEAAPAPAPDVVISAFVSKGPVDGAACTFFGPGHTTLGSATSVRGAVSLARSGVSLVATDAYVVQCTGGQYQDEATGLTTTLGSLSGAAIVDGQGRRAILTPLTQMAWDQAGGQPERVIAEAEKIAKAFGLQGVDILRTQPTDVNTQAAGNDAAGRYGIALAALAQYAKDTGQGMLAATNTLRAALAGSDRLDPAQAVALKAAVDNLRNATQNANAAVRANVAATVATDIGANIVANTVNAGLLLPSSLAISVNQGTVQLGSSQRVSVTARSTSPQPFAFASSNTGVATVDADGAVIAVGEGTATISVSQAASAQYAAAQDSVTVTVTRQTVPTASFAGVGASKSVAIGDDSNFVAGASFSCASEPGYEPVVSYRSSDDTLATVDATGAVAVKATGTATITASVAASGTCAAQSVSYVLQVTHPASPKMTGQTLTSATTVAGSLVSGGNAGTWTLRGTGFAPYTIGGVTHHRVTAVAVDNVPCKSAGSINAAGTEISGVDCTNIPTAESSNSITLTLLNAGPVDTHTIPMVQAPIPTLSISASVAAFKLGTPAFVDTQGFAFPTRSVLRAHGVSSGRFSWTMEQDGPRFYRSTVAGGFSSPEEAFNLDTLATVGETRVTVQQQAVPGMYAAATATFVLRVTDRDVPVGTFSGGNDRRVTLGDAPIDVAASFTCASSTPDYAPTVTVELGPEADGIATLSEGRLSFAKAGTVVVTAKADGPFGTCDKGSAQMTVQIDKAMPELELDPPTVIAIGGEGTSSGVTVSTLDSPALTGAVTYTTSDESVVTVDSNGNIVGKHGGTATITVNVAGDDNYLAPPSQSYTVSVRDAAVTVTGLDADQKVGVRLEIGAAAQTASLGNGANQWFAATGLAKDASYTATVTDVPVTKLCTVSAGDSGTIADTTTSVTVTCTDRFVKVSSAGADLPSSATSWCAVRDDKNGTTWQAGALTTLPGGPGAGTYDADGNATNATGRREIANRDALCGARDWLIPQAGVEGLEAKAVPPYIVAVSTTTTTTRLCADTPDVPQCLPIIIMGPVGPMPGPTPTSYTVTTTGTAYEYNATIGAFFAGGTVIADDPVWLIQGTAQDATTWLTLGNGWDSATTAADGDVAAPRLMRAPAASGGGGRYRKGARR